MGTFNHVRSDIPEPAARPTNHGFDMTGRKILVTGGSTGIGAAISLRLAEAGAAVAAVSRSGRLPAVSTVAESDVASASVPRSGRLSGVSAESDVASASVPRSGRLSGVSAESDVASRSGRLPAVSTVTAGRLVAVRADLSDRSQLDTVVERAVTALGGGLDTVVNNAGRGDWLPLAELDKGYFDGLVGLNLWAPLRVCQLAYPYLKAATGDAAVVMIGSVDAVRPSAGGAVYGATKAGLAAATVALAKEWADDGIRVTQVNPGLVDTPMAAQVVARLAETGQSINIAGRAGQPDEIAALVHYLVAPVGRFATGVSFRLDGGAVALGPFDMRST